MGPGLRSSGSSGSKHSFEGNIFNKKQRDGEDGLNCAERGKPLLHSQRINKNRKPFESKKMRLKYEKFRNNAKRPGGRPESGQKVFPMASKKNNVRKNMIFQLELKNPCFYSANSNVRNGPGFRSSGSSAGKNSFQRNVFNKNLQRINKNRKSFESKKMPNNNDKFGNNAKRRGRPEGGQKVFPMASKKKNLDRRISLEGDGKNMIFQLELKNPCSDSANSNVRNDTSRQIKKTTERMLSKISSKRLHKQKKKAISQIHGVQEILGETKAPDEKEKELQSLVFGYDSDDLEEHGQLELPTEKPSKVQKEPAWEDDDDENFLVEEKAKVLQKWHRSSREGGGENYSAYVEEKFKKLMGAPKWAEMNNSEEENSDDESADEFLQRVGNKFTNSTSLREGVLKVSRCPTLWDRNLRESFIKSIEFHPSSRVALVAGTKGVVNLFQIDGKLNAKIQSVYFERFPIATAHFTVDGNQIIAGSNMCGHFFTYDMIAGKIIRVPWEKGMQQKNVRNFHLSPDGKYIVIHGHYGLIHLVTANTKEWVGSLKMNGEVIAVTFNKDGSKMYSHGSTGEIYVWDMSTRSCIHKFEDEGCVKGTALALSPNDQFLVSGSDSGVVNVYDHNEVLKSSCPKPLKAIMNLTTRISTMKFNHTSELLAVSSCYKPSAIKMVHFPSLTVFYNFPAKRDISGLKYVKSLDISVNSGYFGVGNSVGSTYVYRMRHFGNY